MHDPEVAPETNDAGEIYSETASHYVEAIGTVISKAIDGPDECRALDEFAALFTGQSELVADLGCGPGRAAAYLARSGVDVVGFDIAPGMIAAARAAHPSIAFEVGTLTALPVEDQSLDGAVCWYSIIHTPPEKLVAIWLELRRVLCPSAPVLLAFQAGHGDRVERPGAGPSDLMLVNYRHEPDHVAESLLSAGFSIESISCREPSVTAAHETSDQAMVLARV